MSKHIHDMPLEMLFEVWQYLDIYSLRKFAVAFGCCADRIMSYGSSARFAKKLMSPKNFLQKHKTREEVLVYFEVGCLIRQVQDSAESGYTAYLALLKHLEAALQVKDEAHETEMCNLCTEILKGLYNGVRPRTLAQFVVERVDVNFVKAKLNMITAAGVGTRSAIEKELRFHVIRKVRTSIADSVIPSALLRQLDSPRQRALLAQLLHYPMHDDGAIDWQMFSRNELHSHEKSFSQLGRFIGQLWRHASSAICLDKEEILSMVKLMIDASVNQPAWSSSAVREFLRIQPIRHLALEMIRKGECAYLARFLEIFRLVNDGEDPFSTCHLIALVAAARTHGKFTDLDAALKEFFGNAVRVNWSKNA